MNNKTTKEILWLAILSFLVVFLWALCTNRLDAEKWKYPLQYESDGLMTGAWVKSASEGDFIPLVTEGSPRLGAPYKTVWYDYPINAKFVHFIAGIVMSFFGYGFANNFGPVFGHVTIAICFYLACRILRYPRIWSFTGAVIYAFSHYAYGRQWEHLLLMYVGTLAFAVLSVWLVTASKRMRFGDKFSWICLVTAFVMGIGHPYFLNMYLQLLCFGILAQYVSSRRIENLKIGVLSLLIAIAGFFLINSRTFIYQWAHGKNDQALSRNYYETELYALKPMEFVVPPDRHHVEALAKLGDLYKASAMVKGELFSPYLGLIGLAGMIWILALFFLRMAKNESQPRRFPLYPAQIIWVIFYSIIGGLNCLMGICGFQLFRASNRYSVFVFLIIMLFLVSKISTLARHWRPGMRYALAIFLIIIGVYDQVPGAPLEQDQAKSEMALKSDQAFGAKLEETIPHAGMVFQLPVMSYPEGLPIRGVSTYEMFRPYLWTKTLRFSYGAVRGRTRDDWQYEAEKLPVPQMVQKLESYGFSALYLNRKCYEDHGEGIIGQLAALGRTNVVEDGLHEQTCVLLNPSPTPELPHTDDRAQFFLGSGWAIKDRGPLENREWSTGDATFSFFNESPDQTPYKLTCVVATISDRKVNFEMNGQKIWSSELIASKGTPAEVVIRAKHGYNTVRLSTDAPPTRVKDFQIPLAFMLGNLRITKSGL